MVQHAPVAAAQRRRARSGRMNMLRAALNLPSGLLLRRLLFALKQPYHATALYRWQLGGRAPTQPQAYVADAWPGEAALGQGILQNRLTLAGRTLAHPVPFWEPEGADDAWWEELHAFSWLRDLRVLGGDAARRRARELTSDWIARHPAPGRPPWAPGVLGMRLANWLGHHEFFVASADADFQARVLASMAQQARHLYRVLPAGLAGRELIAAIKGLIYAGVCLPGGETWLRRGLDLLEAELPRQILADGGHIARSPSLHLAVVRDLIDIRAVLAAGGWEGSRSLTLAIEGMTPVVKLFRHGDGGLALFNDSWEERAVDVDMLLQRAGTRARPQAAAPQSGFQRLQAGRTLVIVDAGAPAPPGYDEDAHAGTLSFEMSHGRSRVIVNCGAHPGDEAWRMAQRSTAAHSTLTLAETNSSEVLPNAIGRRPANVICRREENEGAFWLEMSHDGYRRSHDATHMRRLYLAANGDDLRGEETVQGPAGLPFAVRFHLHPDVTAGLVQDGSAVLLRATSGGGWRLRAEGAALGLEESIYLGARGEARRSMQIVLAGTTDEGRSVVKWRLNREGGK